MKEFARNYRQTLEAWRQITPLLKVGLLETKIKGANAKRFSFMAKIIEQAADMTPIPVVQNIAKGMATGLDEFATRQAQQAVESIDCLSKIKDTTGWYSPLAPQKIINTHVLHMAEHCKRNPDKLGTAGKKQAGKTEQYFDRAVTALLHIQNVVTASGKFQADSQETLYRCQSLSVSAYVACRITAGCLQSSGFGFLGGYTPKQAAESALSCHQAVNTARAGKTLVTGREVSSLPPTAVLAQAAPTLSPMDAMMRMMQEQIKALQKQFEGTMQELKTVKEENQGLKTQVGDLTEQVGAVMEKNTLLEQKVENLTQEVGDLKTQNQSLTGLVNEIGNEHDNLADRVSKKYKDLARRVATVAEQPGMSKDVQALNKTVADLVNKKPPSDAEFRALQASLQKMVADVRAPSGGGDAGGRQIQVQIQPGAEAPAYGAGQSSQLVAIVNASAQRVSEHGYEIAGHEDRITRLEQYAVTKERRSISVPRGEAPNRSGTPLRNLERGGGRGRV